MTTISVNPAPGAADTAETEVGSGRATPGYFPRRLQLSDPEEAARHVDESGMLATTGAKIVLGEPGMGKSELMRELGRRLDMEPVTALRFMLSKDPAKFVVSGKPLLIDGLRRGDRASGGRRGRYGSGTD